MWQETGRVLNVAGDCAALLEILLVILLGLPEGLGGDDLGDDRLPELLLRGQLLDHLLRRRFLFGRVKEDRTAVLRSPIGALAVELGGVVEFEEGLYDL